MELHGICSVIHYWQKGEIILLGKKIMEENSNYENRKYTHKRKHYCTVKVAIIENKTFQDRQMQVTSASNSCTFLIPQLI